MNKYTYSNKAKTEIGHPSHNGGYAARIKFADRSKARAALAEAQKVPTDGKTRKEYQRLVKLVVLAHEALEERKSTIQSFRHAKDQNGHLLFPKVRDAEFEKIMEAALREIGRLNCTVPIEAKMVFAYNISELWESRTASIEAMTLIFMKQLELL